MSQTFIGMPGDGTDSNVIRLLPPLTMPDDLLRRGLTIIRDALSASRTTRA